MALFFAVALEPIQMKFEMVIITLVSIDLKKLFSFSKFKSSWTDRFSVGLKEGWPLWILYFALTSKRLSSHRCFQCTYIHIQDGNRVLQPLNIVLKATATYYVSPIFRASPTCGPQVHIFLIQTPNLRYIFEKVFK